MKIEGRATASVFSNTVKPEYAIDGNFDTKWSSRSLYAWWMFETETVSHIDHLTVDTCDGGAYRYYIEASTDSINWQLVAEKDVPSVCKEGGDVWETDFDASFIRITFRSNSLGTVVSLGKFECFGTPDSGYVRPQKAGDRFFGRTATENKGFELIEAWDDLMNMPVQVMSCNKACSFLKFSSVDFGEGANEMQGYFGFPVADKRLPHKLLMHIEFRTDSLDGPVIGTFEAFRQWVTFGPLACDIENTKGVHDVYVILKDIDEGQSFYVNWLSFVKAAELPEPEHPYKETEQGDEFNCYIGLLHSHTSLSDGMNTPIFACEYAKNVSHLDFLGISEHSNLFDNPYDSLNSRKLKDLKEYTESETEDGKFVALFGSETTWYNGFGHMNIYDEEKLYLNASQVKYNDVATYYATVKRFPHAINQWNHPWSCGFRHLDYFSPYDSELDKVMYLLEMNPQEDPDNFGMNYYLKALKEGYHVAPCGSQDNHMEDWGTYSVLRTGIVASELTKKGLLDAIRHRRVYFTCEPGLEIQFRVNGHIMGSRISECNEYTFEVDAFNRDAKRTVSKVEILNTEGKIVTESAADGRKSKVTLVLKGEKDRCYFAKVTLDDGSFAVSSPVWIE